MSNCSSPGAAIASAELIVYTVVLDDYDLVLPPAEQTQPSRFFLFTDTVKRVKGWQTVPPASTSGSPIMANRFHKFFPHMLFPSAEYSLYVDGNIGVIGDLYPLFVEFVESGTAMGVFRHRDRQTVEQEAEACLTLEKFDAIDIELVEEQIAFYDGAGMPKEQTLSDNAVIFRWHGHPKMADAMQEWWVQFQTYTKRDQLSLPYIVWKHSLPVKIWHWSFRAPNEYLVKYPHRGSFRRSLRTRLKHFLKLKGIGGAVIPPSTDTSSSGGATG